MDLETCWSVHGVRGPVCCVCVCVCDRMVLHGATHGGSLGGFSRFAAVDGFLGGFGYGASAVAPGVGPSTHRWHGTGFLVGQKRQLVSDYHLEACDETGCMGSIWPSAYNRFKGHEGYTLVACNASH